MKKPYFIILPLLLIIVVWFVLAKHDKVKALKGCSMDDVMNNKVDTSAYSKLTMQERKDYTITIGQSKINAPHDTIMDENSRVSVINIPVKFSNHSNSTLTYIMWTCGWNEAFYVSNKDIEILGWSCEANFPDDITLAAHSDTTYVLPLISPKRYMRGERFKITMSIFISDQNGRNECARFALNNFRGKNLIWSNEVMLP